MNSPSVAVDVMGGDNAPESILGGIELALSEFGLHLVLSGPEDLISSRLENKKFDRGTYEILPADEVIEMDADPVSAVRRKKNSSLLVAADAVKEGKADALVSAGNTGAVMAGTKLKWGVQEKIDRPAIATMIPTRTGDYTILVDVGANVDCTPRQLVEFGLMGAVYSETVLEKTDPSIGLLNLGHEVLKGNNLTRNSFDLFEEQPLNFVGNVEGDHVTSAGADVIVCDGFVGNVALKISEGVAEFIYGLLKDKIKESWRGMAGGWLMKPVFEELADTIDPSEVGGAPLLGLNHGCIIAHGSSPAKAIKNAIHRAQLFVGGDCNHVIGERIKKLNLTENQNES
ncbi:MAG: phosphate acyltransferase PlsX [bacterium]